MSADIKKHNGGWKARGDKINELVKRVNALSSMSVSRIEKTEQDDSEVGELVEVGDKLAKLILKEPEGSAGITDFLFVFRDGSEVEIDFATVTGDYNSEASWSIKIPVNSGALDTDNGNWTYEAGTDFYDDPQTYYRLTIYRAGKLLNSGGVFKEEIFEDSGNLIVGLFKG